MNRAQRRRQEKLATKNNNTATKLVTSTLAFQFGVKHLNEGNLPEAERYLRQVLDENPDHANALHHLGMLAYRTRNFQDSVDLISKAISIQPDFPDAYNNLGSSYQNLGQIELSIQNYEQALSQNPNFPVCLYNLAVVTNMAGRADEAAEIYGRAIVLDPNYTDALYNLGGLYQDRGQHEKAIECFDKAIALDPGHANAHNRLGLSLPHQGKLLETFHSFQRAVIAEPTSEMFWNNLATALVPLRFSSADENLWKILSQILMQRIVNPASLSIPIFSALFHHPDFGPIFTSVIQSPDHDLEQPYSDIAMRLSGVLLFLQTIALSPISMIRIETLLTRLRRGLIEEALTTGCDPAGLPFSSALALHCFTNEYVYSESDHELALVTELEEKIADLVSSNQDLPPEFIVALGTYRPLFSYPWAETISQMNWSGEVAGVVKRQILDPLREREIRQDIPAITPIEGAVSQAVRAQYEENPYPRWVKNKVWTSGSAIDRFMKLVLKFDLKDYVAPVSPEILIAGCGTGQHVLISTTLFSNPRVLAVDLSLSSLSYASRKAQEYGREVEFAQADILELGQIDRQFDIVESCGVLHHLSDPQAGWQVLVDLLRPGGLMKIALYSEAARHNIIAGQKLVAQGQYSSTSEDIRRCRQTIIAKATAGDPEMAGIMRSADFYSLSECRDLLFHVQEHRFTLPQIEKAIDQLGLQYLGMDITDNDIKQSFAEKFSNGNTPGTLAQWHEFEEENPDTFITMYQFWCRKPAEAA